MNHGMLIEAWWFQRTCVACDHQLFILKSSKTYDWTWELSSRKHWVTGFVGPRSSCSDTDGSLIPGRNQETYLSTDTNSTQHILFGEGNLHLFESIWTLKPKLNHHQVQKICENHESTCNLPQVTAHGFRTSTRFWRFWRFWPPRRPMAPAARPDESKSVQVTKLSNQCGTKMLFWKIFHIQGFI